MDRASKSLTLILILIMIASSLIIVGTAPFGLAQSETTVNSTIINSDKTWTKASSPYTVSGTVTVKNGATLTIEAGATVNIPQSASLQIEGTLIAKGTPSDNIVLNGGGNLILVYGSEGWNQTTGSGCIIENAKISLYSFTVCNSAKIDHNTINCGIYPDGGSPIISDNNVVGAIWGNESVQAPLITNNTVTGCISIPAGSPVITKNVVAGVEGGISNGSSYIPTSLCTAIMAGPASAGWQLNAVISDNTVTCGLDGITVGEGDGTNAVIENNLVENCARYGMSITSTALVENNTLLNNTIGIVLANFNSGIYGPTPTTPTIMGNNVLNSSQANVYSYCTMNMSATYNWWGTTDESKIKQTIHDHAFDPAVGVINVMPCLTEANPFAYPNPNNNSIPNPITTIPINANLTASSMPSQTNTNSTATPAPTPNSNSFAIESNSTISALYFNATSSEISFTVNGPTGTTGYVKATISKAFMPLGENIKVYLDGNQLNYTETSNQENWIITFTYHHSIHQVKINQEPNPARTITPTEDKNLIYVAAGIIAALIAFLGLIIWVTLGQKHSLRNKESRN